MILIKTNILNILNKVEANLEFQKYKEIPLHADIKYGIQHIKTGFSGERVKVNITSMYVKGKSIQPVVNYSSN